MLSVVFLFLLRLCMRALGTSRLIPSIATPVTGDSLAVTTLLPSVFVRHNRDDDDDSDDADVPSQDLTRPVPSRN